MADESSNSSLLEKVDFRIALKTALVATLGWTLGIWWSHRLDRPDTLVSGLWCAMSAIVVLQAYIGGTYKAAWTRFSGVAIGSVLGGLCTTLLGSSPISLGISIFCSVIACTLLNLKEGIRIACLSVTVVMVLWGLHPSTSPWTFAFFRAIDSSLGIILALVVAHLFWPFRAKHKLRKNTGEILVLIHHAYRIVMHIAATGEETAEEVGQLAVKIEELMYENTLVLEEAKMELLTEPGRLDSWISLHDQVDELYRDVMALARVHDQPYKIIDNILSQQLANAVNEMDRIQQEFSSKLISRQPMDSLTSLERIHKNLEEDLLRFRDIHMAKNLNLTEIENFFVFFYAFNALIATTQKTAKAINIINRVPEE